MEEEGGETEREIPDYFGYDTRSYQVAKRGVSRACSEEWEVFRYLKDKRPQFLNVGDSRLGLDAVKLRNHFLGIGEKLAIHGYPERNERLRYLYEMLCKKLEDEDDTLKMITRFLVEMSERPTAVIHLEVGNVKYSERPDDEVPDEHSISDRDLLKEILGEDEGGVTISYSSESDLSEWSDDENRNVGENPPENKVSKSSSIPNSKSSMIRPSQSFSDFSMIADEDSKRREIAQFWDMESLKTKNFWKFRESSDLSLPLTNQPVITGLLTLHSKFGEYWEWKRTATAGNHNDRFVVSEELVINEIIWQFVILDANSSVIFTSDWEVKPGLLTSSLSHSSFMSLLRPIGLALKSLYQFKIFIERIEQESNSLPQESSSKIAKILICYSNGLQQLLHFFSSIAEEIERSIQMRKQKQDQLGSSVTMLQVSKNLRVHIDCIAELDKFHSSLFAELLTESDPIITDQNLSLKLLFSLALKLDEQSSPMRYGFFVFLFSECLHAFLEEINASFINIWKEHLLFHRSDSEELKLSDPTFWSECIMRKQFSDDNEEMLKKIPAFYNLLEQMIMILKTLEMLRQLGEDSKKIIVGPPQNSRAIVNYFVRLMFPQLLASPSSQTSAQDTEGEKDTPNSYTDSKHLHFLGFAGSFESQAFRTILQKNSRKKKPCRKIVDKFCLLKLSAYPDVGHWDVLDATFKAFYGPMWNNANKCTSKIFQDHKVKDSLKLFTEIILELREDFAKAVVSLVPHEWETDSSTYTWQNPLCRNPAFQKILNECYPEGRESFRFEFKLEKKNEADILYILSAAKIDFPLNLVITEYIVGKYTKLSKILSKIRKCLWDVTELSNKEFNVGKGTEPNRLLLFRFALLHFCSSFRAYLLIMFENNMVSIHNFNSMSDLDTFREAHSSFLDAIEVQIFRDRAMDTLVFQKMIKMCEILRKYWKTGLSIGVMTRLEDLLKKCWSAIITSPNKDVKELGDFLGPVPSYLYL